MQKKYKNQYIYFAWDSLSRWEGNHFKNNPLEFKQVTKGGAPDWIEKTTSGDSKANLIWVFFITINKTLISYKEHGKEMWGLESRSKN